MSGYALILWYFEQGNAMLGQLKVGYYLVHHYEPASNATLVLGGGSRLERNGVLEKKAFESKKFIGKYVNL